MQILTRIILVTDFWNIFEAPKLKIRQIIRVRKKHRVNLNINEKEDEFPCKLKNKTTSSHPGNGCYHNIQHRIFFGFLSPREAIEHQCLGKVYLCIQFKVANFYLVLFFLYSRAARSICLHCECELCEGIAHALRKFAWYLKRLVLNEKFQSDASNYKFESKTGFQIQLAPITKPILFFYQSFTITCIRNASF